MASTYSTNLAIELIGIGEQSGVWGTTTNNNLGTLLEQSISGNVTQAITDGADTTITIPSGTTGVARNIAIEMTGALTATRNLIVPANKKLYFIFNNTTGGFAVTVKVTGQTGVSVPNGAKIALVSNGTDVVSLLNYMASLTLGAALPVASGGTGITALGTGVATALGINVGSAGAFVTFNGAGGTPSSMTATNLTGTATSLNIGGNAATASAIAVGGITGLGTGVATALAVNVGSAGAFVTFNGAGGTPSSMTATNLTGTASGLTAGSASAVALGGITGLGTGIATALAVNVGTAGAPVINGGVLGTPSSGTLTNCTFPTLNQNTTGTAAGLSVTLAIASGGTGATSASTARTSLDVPSNAGSGASGTWSINVTGNAATATSATSATNATNATNASTVTTNANLTGAIVTSSGNATTVNMSPITNSLGADVALSNTALYFDGPSVAQGASGTWFVSGSVTVGDGTGSQQFYGKLWDGTTLIASGYTQSSASAETMQLSLSGYISSPAGNLRISVREPAATSGFIKYSATGEGKDSTITAIRIA